MMSNGEQSLMVPGFIVVKLDSIFHPLECTQHSNLNCRLIGSECKPSVINGPATHLTFVKRLLPGSAAFEQHVPGNGLLAIDQKPKWESVVLMGFGDSLGNA